MKNVVCFLLMLGIFAGCGPKEGKNVSPSGRFEVSFVNIPNPKNPKLMVQQAQIKDFEGQPLYKDPSPQFSSIYEVKWAWDADDRLWAFDTDSQIVSFWQIEKSFWQKRKYGKGRKTFAYEHLTPPESIFPEGL